MNGTTGTGGDGTAAGRGNAEGVTAGVATATRHPSDEAPTAASGRRRRRWLRGLVAAVTVLAVALGGVHLWARANTATSTLARTLAWFEADVGDVERFPQRAIAASREPSPLADCADGLDLSTAVTTGDREVALDELLATTRTRGFLVLRDGCVLAEHYGEGADAQALLTSFSVAKSVLATLIGIAVDRGDLPGIDVPVTDYVPELRERDPRFSDVTLASLMAMSSGLRYTETGTPWGDDARTYYGVDLREVALSAQVEDPPMTRWLYNNDNPLIAGMVLERATGASAAAYAQEHLWGPMGAEHDASWSLDSTDGIEKLESGVNATLRDWGRFGLLAAHAGEADDGAHVASPQFWERATHPQPTASGDLEPGYGLWWWVDTERAGAFYAHGNFGQFIYVDPATDVVVLRFGEDYGIDDWPSVLGDVARAAAA